MDDSYKDVDPIADMVNPCEIFDRKAELEDPLRPDVMDQWLKKSMEGKQERVKPADGEEEEDDIIELPEIRGSTLN